MAPFLELKDVCKKLGNHQAVDKVSFAIHPGECFGLLGPNGAGKTTLLSIISCLHQADAGQALLLGEPLGPDKVTIRKQIGLVPQELAIYGNLSARENLQFFGQLYGFSSIKLKSKVDSVLHSIGLEQRANDRAETFSGGMQRRLNLGIALMHEPLLLLLDEPTVGVDPQSRNHLFEEIQRLHQTGTTIIYTSHYMEEVQALCNRVGIMDHGKLIACDTIDKLTEQAMGEVRLEGDKSLQEWVGRALPEATVKWNEDATQATIRSTNLPEVMRQILERVKSDPVTLSNLTTKSPTLEDVFLQLTGRELRD